MHTRIETQCTSHAFTLHHPIKQNSFHSKRHRSPTQRLHTATHHRLIPHAEASPSDTIATSTQSTPSTSAPDDKLELQVTLAKSITNVSKSEWDACANGNNTTPLNPFISYDFLRALEDSGSACPSQGWLPQHLLLRNTATKELVACAPMYLKSHSYGEYVFDNSWAQAHDRMTLGRGGGPQYYPKLQSCVPFTPATGSRLLIKPGPMSVEVKEAAARCLVQITQELGVSGIHITFNTYEEARLLERYGFMTRLGMQYHWINGTGKSSGSGGGGSSDGSGNNTSESTSGGQQQPDEQPEQQEQELYTSFQDFEAQLTQKRRKSVRQERKKVQNEGWILKRLTGSDLTNNEPLWDSFYDFYLDTAERRWGHPYLTRDFFSALGSEALCDKIMLAVAIDPFTNKPIAAALNLIGSDTLFGRNWGILPGLAGSNAAKGLHFELCYYQAIEFAIERGLRKVEAGAQGEHKLGRGYLPSVTYSSHYMRHPGFSLAVESFLKEERYEIRRMVEVLTKEASPFKV